MGYASALDFLVLSLTCIISIYTWFLGSGWPLPLLGNSLIFRTKLVSICDCQIYFF